MQFLVHFETGRVRAWTDKYGPNMRVVDEHEVLRLNPNYTSVEQIVQYADPNDNSPAPATAPVTVAEDIDAVEEAGATPAALMLAREHNVDLEGVTGTGREGTIVKSDVQAAIDAALLDQI